METRERKSKLRNELLSRRMAVPDSSWEDKSTIIGRYLLSLPEFKNASVIHAFVSMNDRKEVNTHSLIPVILQAGKQILVPVTDFEDLSLTSVELTSMEDLQMNKWGIPEPVEETASNLEPDLILVPLLAADLNFNRLGYGKGFYDRFLEGKLATKVGLLFEDFLIDEIPVEGFDQKLDILITEKRVYHRNKAQ